MADFEDEFTETSDTLLKNHTPDVGTSWSWTGTNDDGYLVSGANDLLFTDPTGTGTEGTGYSLLAPDLGSADQQVWFRLKTLTNYADNAFACVRLVDEDNFIGNYVAGTGAAGRRLAKCVSGTVTDLVTSQGVDEEWIRVTAEGNSIKLWEGGTGSEPTSPTEDTNWTQVGSTQTVTDHNTETSTGFAKRSTSGGGSDWMDSYRANTVGGGGGGGGGSHLLTLLGVG